MKDPRESMRVLPQWLQPLLTAITGKPLAGEQPRPKTPLYHLLIALGALGFGVALSCFASSYGGLWLLALLPGWILTVGGARKLQVMIVHQCAHENFTGIAQIDTVVGELISILLLIGRFVVYKLGHLREHHARLMTSVDPTLQFLMDRVHLRPGMSREQLWRQVYKTLWSPKFHAYFLASRIKAHIYNTTPDHLLAIGGYVFLLLSTVALTNMWLSFLLAWVLPLTVFYQISACLRLCVEHLYIPGDEQRDRQHYASLTQAIFLGEPVPDTASLPLAWKVWGWLRWTGLMFIHLLVRVCILVGDTPVHDYHHRHPRSPKWTQYAFARQEDVDSGHPGWTPYQEVWGLWNAIDAVLTSFSNAPTVQAPH